MLNMLQEVQELLEEMKSVLWVAQQFTISAMFDTCAPCSEQVPLGGVRAAR